VSRTVSARISREMHEKLRERCNNAGCSINDWLEAAIEYLFTGSSDFDFGDEEELIETGSEPLNSKQPKIMQGEIIKPRTFTCKNGRLFENGVDIGSTRDFELNKGKVYDKQNNFLGNIDNKEPYIMYLD